MVVGCERKIDVKIVFLKFFQVSTLHNGGGGEVRSHSSGSLGVSSGTTLPQALEKNVSQSAHWLLGKMLSHWVYLFVKVGWCLIKRAETTDKQVSGQFLWLWLSATIFQGPHSCGDAQECFSTAFCALPWIWVIVGLVGISFWNLLSERWDCLYHNTGKKVWVNLSISCILQGGMYFQWRYIIENILYYSH